MRTNEVINDAAEFDADLRRYERDYLNGMNNIIPNENERGFMNVLAKQMKYPWLGHCNRNPEQERKIMDNIKSRVKKLSATALLFVFMMIGTIANAQKPTTNGGALKNQVFTSVMSMPPRIDVINGNQYYIWSLEIVNSKGVVLYETSVDEADKVIQYANSPKNDARELINLVVFYQVRFEDGSLGVSGTRIGKISIEELQATPVFEFGPVVGWYPFI